MNYKKAYTILFNAITESQEHLNKSNEILILAQQKTEAMFIEFEPADLLKIKKKDEIN